MAKQVVNSTPPPPGAIASVKPKERKPWCPNCRAHTHDNTTKVQATYSGNGGNTTDKKYETHFFGVVIVQAACLCLRQKKCPAVLLALKVTYVGRICP